MVFFDKRNEYCLEGEQTVLSDVNKIGVAFSVHVSTQNEWSRSNLTLDLVKMH